MMLILSVISKLIHNSIVVVVVCCRCADWQLPAVRRPGDEGRLPGGLVADWLDAGRPRPRPRRRRGRGAGARHRRAHGQRAGARRLRPAITWPVLARHRPGRRCRQANVADDRRHRRTLAHRTRSRYESTVFAAWRQRARIVPWAATHRDALIHFCRVV